MQNAKKNIPTPSGNLIDATKVRHGVSIGTEKRETKPPVLEPFFVDPSDSIAAKRVRNMLAV
jgi:hypothetical protein